MRNTNKPAQSGFSLMELLIVLVIIGLLTALVAPTLLNQAAGSRQTAAEAQIKMLRGALETMHLNMGRYPTTSEGLALLNTPPADSAAKSAWKGPYLNDELPPDPWGHPYQYEFTGVPAARPFYLYSLGSDKAKGGEGLAKDIGYAPQ